MAGGRYKKQVLSSFVMIFYQIPDLSSSRKYDKALLALYVLENKTHWKYIIQ